MCIHIYLHSRPHTCSPLPCLVYTQEERKKEKKNKKEDNSALFTKTAVTVPESTRVSRCKELLDMHSVTNNRREPGRKRVAVSDQSAALHIPVSECSSCPEMSRVAADCTCNAATCVQSRQYSGLRGAAQHDARGSAACRCQCVWKVALLWCRCIEAAHVRIMMPGECASFAHEKIGAEGMINGQVEQKRVL